MAGPNLAMLSCSSKRGTASSFKFLGTCRRTRSLSATCLSVDELYHAAMLLDPQGTTSNTAEKLTRTWRYDEAVSCLILIHGLALNA